VCSSDLVLPSLVEADELARVSALTVGARTVGYALGPLVGGAGAALVGAREVLLLNAASFLVSACLVVGLPRGGSGAPARRRAPGRMRDGFQALLSSPALRGVTGGWMLGRIAFGFAATAQVALAASLGAGPTGLGVLVTALGLGSLGGAPLAGRLVGSRGQAAVAIGLCLIAGGFAVTVCATTLLMAAIGLVLAGAGDAVSTVGEEVVLLGSTDEGLRGRTVAAYETLLVGSGLAAYPLAALIASSGAGRVGFGVATGLALGAAAVARRGGRPSDASQRTSTVTTSIALLP